MKFSFSAKEDKIKKSEQIREICGFKKKSRVLMKFSFSAKEK